jgi:putative hydrolase of the HAD superfamily
MVEAVRRCHRHFKTGLLTNNFLTPLGGTGFEDLSHLFDVVVESARAGIRKPDPRFYELALAQLQVAPDEAVFLDDLGINLKPARAMGMTTIRVGDPTDAISQLEEVLGIPLLQMKSD